MKLISLSFILINVILSSCGEELLSADIQKIEFGTSFGLCAGYCTQTLEISEGFVKKTVTPRANQDLETRSCEREFNSFKAVVSKVDLKAFSDLEETIGCPDCADGGAEWIKITSINSSKTVTYEYGKEPNEVKSFISDLRSLYDNLGECTVSN